MSEQPARPQPANGNTAPSGPPIHRTGSRRSRRSEDSPTCVRRARSTKGRTRGIVSSPSSPHRRESRKPSPPSRLQRQRQRALCEAWKLSLDCLARRDAHSNFRPKSSYVEPHGAHARKLLALRNGGACGSSYDLPIVPRAARTCNALLDDLVGTTGPRLLRSRAGRPGDPAPTPTVAHSDGRDERRRRRRGWTSSALRGPCSIRRARPSRAVARHVRQGNSGANQ